MVDEEIYERADELGRIVSSNDWNSEFDAFRKRTDKLKKELISTRSCYDYILKEIEKENENISNMLKWNQKRIDLLNEIANKIFILNDKIDVLHTDMFECIFKDYKDFKTQK